MADLMLIGQKELGALQSCCIGVIVEFPEIPKLGTGFVVDLGKRGVQGQDGAAMLEER